MSAGAAIRAEGLTKVYRYHEKDAGLAGSLRSLVRRRSLEKRAVDHITFTIGTGEIVGFLGPNGAGKTTTLKMLCGLLSPSGGTAEVLGYTPARRDHAFLRRISLVMGQKTMLYWDLPAMETLLLQQEMYGVSDADFRRTVATLGSMLDVEHLLRVQTRKLSLGERMKLELLAALLHSPEVLFLDEPTIGLDVVSQQRVREFLVELNRERGTTILLTSHYMDDIEALCPRVMVIDEGHISFDGSLASLIQRMAPHKRITATLVAPLPIDAAQRLGLQPEPGDDPLTVHLTVEREHVADAASRLLQLGGVVDLSIEEIPVEEIVRQIFLRQSEGR